MSQPMPEPLQPRSAPPPTTIVVIRLGEQTLGNQKLSEQCERTHARWGVHGFSVFEVPDNDYQLLARLVPIVTVRPRLFEARGAELLAEGFPLLPTAQHPHWTVVVSEPTAAQFARVRGLFDGPKPNPAFGGAR
jgi:hypothetical protein